MYILPTKDENGRTRSKNSSTVFYFLHLKYESENESGQAGHENEHELTEYLEFRKRTNSSGITSNTVGMRKFNTKYRPTVHSIKQVHDQIYNKRDEAGRRL